MKKGYLSKFWKLMKLCTIQIMMAVACSCLGMAHTNYAQLLDTEISIDLKETSFEKALKEIELVANVKFFYSTDQLSKEERVSLKVVRQSLRNVLNELLTPRKIKFKVHEKEATITLRKQITPESQSLLEDTTTGDIILPISVAVTGKVLDATNQQPMAGVNILVKGTTNGTTTDAEGRFSINVENNDILVFSFIGYTSVEIPLRGQSIVDVSLQEDAKNLNEVVINAGYWKLKEKEQTGNIAKITKDEIAKQPIANPLQALQGRIAGVYIQQANGVPGSNLSVRIRGQNSINSGNEPLYVIDGVPFMAGNLSTTATSANILGTGGISPLNSINPTDIESIEVLKDADATAIYGSRGANGVILITTKKGNAAGGDRVKVDVNFYAGVSQVTSNVVTLNTPQYVAMRKEAFAKDNVVPELYEAPDLLAWDTTRYTNWQKLLIGGTAKLTSLQASVAGGTANTKFSFGGGFQRQGTVFPGDLNADKISSLLSISHNSNDARFKSTFSVIYNSNTSNLIARDLTKKALTLSPNAPALYKEDGSLNWENSTWDNPMAELEQQYKSKISNLIANANIGYEIIKNLELSSGFGFNDMTVMDGNSTPSTYYDPMYGVTPKDASVYFNNSNVKSWIIEPKLNYSKEIGPGNFTAFLGSTFQQMVTQRLIQYGLGFPSDDLINDVASASTIIALDYINSTYRYNAIFARLNYNLQGKYILNATARRDGSSRFGPGNRFANFGAVGAAWVFSNEKFLDTQNFLSFGKLRTSYGTSGNDQIGDYQFLSTYQSSGAPYDGVSGLSPSRLYNPDFAWEINKKFEVGLELGFIKDRIMISTSYYNNRSSNQLINYPLAMTTGFTSVQANLDALVQNTGIEIVLNTNNIKGNAFSWNTSFNITIPKNKLISFPLLEASTYANKYVVGEPLTISKRYQYVDIDPTNGIHRVSDMNGDGVISIADQQQVSHMGVELFGGLNNSLKFKGLRLDVFFQFVKQTGLNYWGLNTVYPGYMVNQPSQLLKDRWVNPGDEGTKVQRFTAGYNQSAVTAFFEQYVNSNAVVQDASFIRLKTISLSYDLPLKCWPNLKSNVYAQAQNLWTFTNYFGLDPENSNNGSLPPLKTIVMGIQISL